MTIPCRSCGADNDQGATVCAFCGEGLVEKVALILDEYQLMFMPLVIATIARLTGLDFVDAKKIVDAAPGATISKNLSRADAEQWQREIEAGGGKCSIGDPSVN